MTDTKPLVCPRCDVEILDYHDRLSGYCGLCGAFTADGTAAEGRDDQVVAMQRVNRWSMLLAQGRTELAQVLVDARNWAGGDSPRARKFALAVAQYCGEYIRPMVPPGYTATPKARLTATLDYDELAIHQADMKALSLMVGCYINDTPLDAKAWLDIRLDESPDQTESLWRIIVNGLQLAAQMTISPPISPPSTQVDEDSSDPEGAVHVNDTSGDATDDDNHWACRRCRANLHRTVYAVYGACHQCMCTTGRALVVNQAGEQVDGVYIYEHLNDVDRYVERAIYCMARDGDDDDQTRHRDQVYEELLSELAQYLAARDVGNDTDTILSRTGYFSQALLYVLAADYHRAQVAKGATSLILADDERLVSVEAPDAPFEMAPEEYEAQRWLFQRVMEILNDDIDAAHYAVQVVGSDGVPESLDGIARLHTFLAYGVRMAGWFRAEWMDAQDDASVP